MTNILKIVLNLLIFILIIGFIAFIVFSVNKKEIRYADNSEKTPFTSPYTQTTVFELPQEINRFEVSDGILLIAAGKTVYVYDTEGKEILSFPVKENLRDITAAKGNIYILYPSLIEVYTNDGIWSRKWEACSELSDYCSLALAGDFVFVTDAENKNICKYTNEGNFVKFIKSPNGFIIPSYSFDIESWNDTLYCTNSGRHLIESYTPDGDFIAAFGGPGTEPGSFVGCCNPAFIAFTPDGKLITSEKGNPRICLFERSGIFDEMLFNSSLLGGGSAAYETKTDGDKFFVAGINTITVYQPDK